MVLTLKERFFTVLSLPTADPLASQVMGRLSLLPFFRANRRLFFPAFSRDCAFPVGG